MSLSTALVVFPASSAVSSRENTGRSSRKRRKNSPVRMGVEMKLILQKMGMKMELIMHLRMGMGMDLVRSLKLPSKTAAHDRLQRMLIAHHCNTVCMYIHHNYDNTIEYNANY